MSGRSYLEQVRFLIVDDNAFSRQLIRAVIQQFGARYIYEAANGDDAKEGVKSFNPDIIIADWVMAPVDGMQFVKWLREANDSPSPFIPVIMVTAYSHMDNVIEARDAGINEFLAKPISAKSLLQRIQSVIDHPRQYVRADAYFGPDRRRRDMPHDGPNRRDDGFYDSGDYDDDDDIVDLNPNKA